MDAETRKKLNEIRRRHEIRTANRSDAEEWVTIKGTHVMVDESGELVGEVGKKIKSSSTGKAIRIRKNGLVPQRPKRPRRSDFPSDEAYGEARAKYAEDRRAFEAEIEKRVQDSVPKEAMSVDQLKSWGEKHNVVIDDSISQVDGRLLTAYTKRFETLAKQYPEGLNITMTDSVTGDSFTSHFELEYEDTSEFLCEATRGCRFGKRCTDAESLAESYITSQAEGYLVNTGCGINSLFDHEYGHRFYNSMQYKAGRTTRDRVKMEEDVLRTLAPTKGRSEYSSQNVDELFAEGFAAYVAGLKTEFAVETGKLIKRWR